MSITSISLSNFQCFGGEVTIPLSRLTFLFGPNSAGKSAVLDAFEILRATAKDFYLGIDGAPPSHDEVVAQKARVRSSIRALDSATGKLTSDDAKKPVMTISVGIGGDMLSAPSNALHEKLMNRGICLKVGYGAVHNYYHRVVLDVVVDGEFLLSIGERENTLNLAHPLLQNLKDKDAIRASLAQEKDRKIVAFSNNKITFPWRDFDNYYSREKSRKGFGDQPGSYDIPLIDLFDEVLFRHIKQLWFAVCRLDVTPASRQIPDDTRLSYFIECGKQLEIGHIPYSKTSSDEDFDSFSLPSLGDPYFRPIAEALAATLDDYSTWTAWELEVEAWREEALKNGEEFDVEGHGKHQWEEYLFWEKQRGFVENVQRSLAEHLFRDVGYQIGFDHRVLMDRRNLDRLRINAFDADLPLIVGQHPILIRLFLVDARGNKLSFSDVGSGLAYVLPVILNVWDPARSRVFLQQPELHLHPALQAPLGDLFIEASRGKGIIVETHSEHILLRVLKRIRQTSSGQPLAEELRIAPEAVSVLYFDPGPDGTTRVKRLRITPDGDFLDRWPRGFFAERDQDLFDE